MSQLGVSANEDLELDMVMNNGLDELLVILLVAACQVLRNTNSVHMGRELGRRSWSLYLSVTGRRYHSSARLFNGVLIGHMRSG